MFFYACIKIHGVTETMEAENNAIRHSMTRKLRNQNTTTLRLQGFQDQNITKTSKDKNLTRNNKSHTVLPPPNMYF